MTVSLLDAAYALLVAGAAMVWPPLALIAGGIYLLGVAITNDRRSAAEKPT